MKSKKPHSPVDLQRVGRAIGIVLLPFLLSDAVPRLKSATYRRTPSGQGYPEQDRGTTHPYLGVIGPTPLRFAPEPIHTLPKSAPPAPPPPAVPDKEHAIETANRQAAELTPEPIVVPAAEVEVEAKQKPPAADALPLLPDDTRRHVRPEDILPFFSFPANGNGSGVIIGAPVQPAQPREKLPPSSATYIQK